MPVDPFKLERFVTAQAPVWSTVCAELRAGHKETHWMWFVFPQLAELGHSPLARQYGLSDVEEAKAYLAHPVLGEHLRDCCGMLLALEGRSAIDIFGTVDAMKLRSCLTLFIAAAPEEAVFHQCLLRYFEGDGDPLTTSLVRSRGTALP